MRFGGGGGGGARRGGGLFVRGLDGAGAARSTISGSRTALPSTMEEVGLCASTDDDETSLMVFLFACADPVFNGIGGEIFLSPFLGFANIIIFSSLGSFGGVTLVAIRVCFQSSPPPPPPVSNLKCRVVVAM